MAKPRELYSGPAPQAMSLMGQGIADAYANAGRIEGQGMAAMGQGIAQGITSAASSVASYMKEAKQLEAQNKSYENFLGNKVGQTILGYTPEQSQQLIGEARKLTLDGGIRAGNDYLNLVVGGRLQQQNKLQQIEAETAGRARAAQKPPMSSNPDEVFGSIFSGTPVAPKTPAAVAPVDQSGQDTTQPATDLAEFLRRKGWSGTGPVPKALMREFEASQPFPNPY
jgi:hypothetical protein